MPELVPTFILDRSEPRGRFPAASLRVDVSGFTAATSALMAHGSEAAEAIADIMEAIFTPLVDAVTDRGGFVATFSGDAFTAAFPLTSGDAAEAGRRAHAAAVAMRDHLAAHPTHQTRFGRFAFTARFGLGSGDVGWGILRPDGSFGHAAADHLAAIYYFNGTAIESAVAAEGLAPDGEIVVGLGSVPTLESPADAPALPAHPVASSGAPTSAAARFVPAAILERSARGEFRQVVSVFINLREAGTHEDLDEFASVVFDLQTRHGGYLNKVEFGDKGCTFLLFWGAPTSHENDLERALGFLLDLFSRAGSDFRAGVTYRHVYAGLIGSARRGEYTCYGEGVNLAARLMSAAPARGVWLDAAVARRAPREFVFEGRGSLSFKGFAEPVAVHELAGRQAVSDRSFFQGEMIGRAAERVRVTDFVRPILDSGASAWGGVLRSWGRRASGRAASSMRRSAIRPFHSVCSISPRRPTRPFVSRSTPSPTG